MREVCRWYVGVGGGGTIFGVEGTTVTEREVSDGVVGVVPPLGVLGVVDGAILIFDTLLCKMAPK